MTGTPPGIRFSLFKLLRGTDIVLIGVLSLALLLSIVLLWQTGSPGGIVLVEVEGKTIEKMDLAESRVVRVEGAHGPLMVETKTGMVAVTESDCPQHICLRTGWRSQAGEIIVCVPNKTVVRILGERSHDVRAITG
jgi:hypothetical protein